MSTIAAVLNDVKEAEIQSGSTFTGYLWMVYFLLSIGVVGGIFAYGMAIPLCLMGIVWRPLWRWGGRAMRLGVEVLLRVQPWLDASRNLDLPKHQTIATFSNHRSHLDMFLLLAQIPNIRVIAKCALFNVPFLGIMMRVLKNIPLKKNNPESYRRAFDTEYRAIREGDHAHFFPEMTRCEPGFVGTQDFHLSPFQVLLKAKVPIYPIVFENTDEVWPKGSFALRTGKKIRMRTLEPIDPSQFQSADALRTHCKRVLDAALGLSPTPKAVTESNIILSPVSNPVCTAS